MFKFHKSRTVAIIKSLATSPLGICILFILGVVSILIFFYCLFLINLYLIQYGTIPQLNTNNNTFSSAINYLNIEVFFVPASILIIYGSYELIIDTLIHVNKDIKQYELDSVVWLK